MNRENRCITTLVILFIISILEIGFGVKYNDYISSHIGKLIWPWAAFYILYLWLMTKWIQRAKS